MFLQNQPRSVWMVPYALFKCNSHCFSVFWPGCHDTQRLLYFVTHSFCGSAQSPTSPIVLVPFPCAAPPLQCCPTLSYFLSSCASLHLTQGSLFKGSPLFIVSAVPCFTLLFRSCQARLKCRQMSTPQDQFPRVAPLITVPPSLLLPSASASLPICLPLLRLWQQVKCPPLKTNSHEWRQLRF